MPSLADYLAKNYLTASNETNVDSDARPTKKRKKNKHSSENNASNSLLIADDDDGLLLSKHNGSGGRLDDGDENDNPLLYNTKVRSAEFRKSKTNRWQTLSNNGQSKGDPGAADGRGDHDDDDDADILLRQTMASQAQRKADQEAENAPAVVLDHTESLTSNQPKMESGARAGLQTAADTARLVAEQEAREEAEAAAEAERQRRRKKKKNKSTEEDFDHEDNQAEETIYRDATGRRIDLTLRRQEARRAEVERIAAEKKAKDDALGEVQLRQREERKQELEDAKFLTLGRTADDEEMNSRMKEEMRWNDPMASYMANKQQEEEQQQISKSSRSSKSQPKGSKPMTDRQPKRKEYQGAAPPNRYGIKPGWRWDGVDRGNGFEKEWFQARGRKARNESLEYQWQMDE